MKGFSRKTLVIIANKFFGHPFFQERCFAVGKHISGFSYILPYIHLAFLLQSLGVFYFVGFFVSMEVGSRRSEAEHYDGLTLNETK